MPGEITFCPITVERIVLPSPSLSGSKVLRNAALMHWLDTRSEARHRHATLEKVFSANHPRRGSECSR
jgi:hypothetical protein